MDLRACHSRVPAAAWRRRRPPEDPLPPWASAQLDRGFRLSVQWRLTNREKFLKKEAKESRAWNISGEGLAPEVGRFLADMGQEGGGGGGGGGGHGMLDVDEIEQQQVQQALALSLQDHGQQQPQPGAAAAGLRAPATAADEEADLQAALLASVAEKPKAPKQARGSSSKEPVVISLLSDDEGEGEGEGVGGGDGQAGGEQQRAGAKRPRSGDENGAATTEAAAGDSATDEQQRMREARLKKLAA